MIIQLLGIAAGSQEPTPFTSDFGFLVIAFDPGVLQPLDQVKQNADKFMDSIRSTKMLPGEPPARLPFERSDECRRVSKVRGWFEVEVLSSFGTTAHRDDASLLPTVGSA